MSENTFNPWKHFNKYNEQIFADKSSDLPQWPIKLWKVPAISPYFHHAHLLIAADCSAFFCPAFVFRAAKMSHLPVPIQVTNLFVDAEDVTE